MSEVERLKLRVVQAVWEADGVVSLTLADTSGAAVPAWKPGAHIDVILPSGLVRQYSLCGDPSDTSSYRIAVLRQPDGRGGSEEIHGTALVGRDLDVRGPRNHFRLVDAEHYLFLAGGIGITPILAMAREVEHAGKPWTLVYGGRSRQSMAFVAPLAALGGERVRVMPQDEVGLIDVAGEVDAADVGTAVYCCGPEPLLKAVEQAVDDRGDLGTLHLERFGSSGAAVDEAAAVEGDTFEVECRRSGVVFTVPPDESILDLVQEKVDADYPYGCTEGYCGSCEAKVLDGIPLHRDEILTVEEKASNEVLMICVGRSKSPRLVLDI